MVKKAEVKTRVYKHPGPVKAVKITGATVKVTYGGKAPTGGRTGASWGKKSTKRY